MVLLYVTTQNGINDAKDKTATAQAEQQAAEAKIGQLQAYGDFATLRTTREAAVRGVAQLRFDYERLMREMALVLPHDTYLTSFSTSGTGPTASTGTATATGPGVTISGCAPSHQGVATAIVRLRKLHNVTDVNLQTDTKAAAATSGSTAVACKVAFNAILSFQPEAGSATQQGPVPARLGGGQ